MSKPMMNTGKSKRVEIGPDAWSRFERAVDAAIKSGPKHRPTAKTKKRPVSKGRVHKGKARD